MNARFAVKVRNITQPMFDVIDTDNGSFINITRRGTYALVIIVGQHDALMCIYAAAPCNTNRAKC